MLAQANDGMCIPQDEMCRSRGVGMTKFKTSKAYLHYEVYLPRPQLAPAATMLPPSPRPPMGPSFRRALIRALQSMAPCDVQV